MDKDLERLRALLEDAVSGSHGQSCGLLLSGGVDSSLTGIMLKRAGAEFGCYTAAFGHGNTGSAADLEAAERTAKFLGKGLQVAQASLEGVENAVHEVARIVGQRGVVHLSVGAAVYLALRKAREQGVKVVYTGMGADELFAGYARFRECRDAGAVNDECKRSLEKLKREDLERDRAIAKVLGIELRTPYLNEGIVEFALGLPKEMKIGSEGNKLVLRRLAEEFGLPKEIAWRAKKAAQYGSGIDKALAKLAKRAGCATKGEYVNVLRLPRAP